MKKYHLQHHYEWKLFFAAIQKNLRAKQERYAPLIFATDHWVIDLRGSVIENLNILGYSSKEAYVQKL